MGSLIDILLVDDDPTDIHLMREALRDARIANRLHTASDGLECLAFLHHHGPFRDAPRPHLILLDLNMPRKGGLQVLAEIKADANLRSIPTIILTSSQADADVARSYDLQANGYVVKPGDPEDFTAIVGGIEQFWVGLARLPKKSI